MIEGQKGGIEKPISLAASSLLVVDVQRGFTRLCPTSCPCPADWKSCRNVNSLLEMPWARIDASQDWHPPDHCSFFGRRDNLYPPHCVMGTPGAEFLPGLRSERFQAIWRKGYDRDFEAYALTAQHPGFVELLRPAASTRWSCAASPRTSAVLSWPAICARPVSASFWSRTPAPASTCLRLICFNDRPRKKVSDSASST